MSTPTYNRLGEQMGAIISSSNEGNSSVKALVLLVLFHNISSIPKRPFVDHHRYIFLSYLRDKGTLSVFREYKYDRTLLQIFIYKKFASSSGSNLHAMSYAAPEYSGDGSDGDVDNWIDSDPFARDRIKYTERPTDVDRLNRMNNSHMFRRMVYPWIDPSPEFESRLRAATLIINQGAETAANISNPSLRAYTYERTYRKAGMAFLYNKYNPDDPREDIIPRFEDTPPRSDDMGERDSRPASSHDGSDGASKASSESVFSTRRKVLKVLMFAYAVLLMSQNINFPGYMAGSFIAISVDVVSWLRRGRQGLLLDWYLQFYRWVIFAAVFVAVVPYGLWFLAVGTSLLIGAITLNHFGYLGWLI